MNRKAVIIGSTGLIGSNLLKMLEQEEQFQEIIILVRKSFNPSTNKSKVHVVDFSEPNNYNKLLKNCTDAFSCLGTTMKKAGSKEAFIQIDKDYVTGFAQQAFLNGCQTFSLVSAIGADDQSLFFYNRIKGEVEKEVGKIPFKTINIFRPSLLLGTRNEKRLGEDLAKQLNKYFSWIIPAKYKGIEGKQVAKAMLDKIKSPVLDKNIFESDDIRKV